MSKKLSVLVIFSILVCRLNCSAQSSNEHGVGPDDKETRSSKAKYFSSLRKYGAKLINVTLIGARYNLIFYVALETGGQIYYRVILPKSDIGYFASDDLISEIMGHSDDPMAE